ncbi:MAG: ankyrin repeat domain-containing protein [Holophaga sp.]|nr:ankyrin repeat domain-containing protein [Holophaga sp.]
MQIGVRLMAWVILAAQVCLAGQVRVQLGPSSGFTLEFDAEAQVLFYPQIHTAPNISLHERATILVSQFALATFLKANPQYEVFSEGSYGLGPEDFPTYSNKSVHDLFPGLAFPEDFSQWFDRKQSALIHAGAPSLLFCLGVLPRVHAAIPPETRRLLDLELLEHYERTGTSFETIDKAGEEILLGKRERATSENVKRFIADHPSKKVLLVFGMGHDFREYFIGSSYAQISGLERLKEWQLSGGGDVPEGKEERKEPASPEERAARIDASQDNHQAQLMEAVSATDLPRVQALLAQGADVRLKDNRGYNALLLACLDANLPMVRELLRHLTPVDVLAPVSLFEEGVIQTFEDILMVLEKENAKPGRQYYEVMKCLRDFSTPPRSKPGATGTSRKAHPAPAPGFLGDLTTHLPPGFEEGMDHQVSDATG